MGSVPPTPKLPHFPKTRLWESQLCDDPPITNCLLTNWWLITDSAIVEIIRYTKLYSDRTPWVPAGVMALALGDSRLMNPVKVKSGEKDYRYEDGSYKPQLDFNVITPIVQSNGVRGLLT